MNEAFERIIEKFKTDHSVILYGSKNSGNYMIPVKDAIKIVEQVAVECSNDQINQLAMMYAKNLAQLGVDITKAWDTAMEQTAALGQAYTRGRKDERDRYEKNNNDWIPCCERLPEDGTTVLVQDFEEYYEVSICETRNGVKGFSSGDWWTSANNYIAWHPLPEPYRTKGEGEA